MNKLSFLTLAVATTASALAQSNTFPASGNVGIGTTSPANGLHIQRPGEATIVLDETVGTKYSISSRWGGYFTIWDETHSQFFDRPRFAINPGSGYVGIGTLFPNSMLEVSHASMAQAPNLALSVGPGASGVGDGPSISFLHSGNERGYRIYERAIATNRGELRFASGNSSAGYDDRVVFDMNGNVGIGTTSPAAKLDVLGEVWSTEALRCTRPALGLNNALGTDGSGGLVGTLSNHHLALWTNGANRVQITTTGNVGIGTIYPQHKLAVNGTIKAKEIIVETSGWSDYVFADSYALQPLSEVEAHIKTNKHLPGIPSAAQVASEGVSVGEFQAKLLAKIEELTLHQIAQEKLLKTQTALVAAQTDELAALRAEVRTLRSR